MKHHLMRTTIVFILAAFFWNPAFSQEDSASAHLRFGLTGAAGLSGSMTKTIYTAFDDFSVESLPRWGFQGGLQVMLSLSDHVWFKTGFGVAQRRFAHRVDGFTFGSDFNPETGQFDETSLMTEGSCTELSLPLMVQSDFWKDRLFFDGGVALNYRMYGEYTRNFTSGAQAAVSRPPIDISGGLVPYIALGMGYQVTTTDGLNLQIGPVANYAITALTLIDASPNLFFVGLRTGLNFAKP